MAHLCIIFTVQMTGFVIKLRNLIFIYYWKSLVVFKIFVALRKYIYIYIYIYTIRYKMSDSLCLSWQGIDDPDWMPPRQVLVNKIIEKWFALFKKQMSDGMITVRMILRHTNTFCRFLRFMYLETYIFIFI